MNKEFYFYNSQISQYGVENGYVDLEAFASNFPHIPLCDKMFNNVEYELINGSNVFYCDSAGKEYTFEHQQDLADGSKVVRFCTSWATTEAEKDQLIRDIRAL